MASIIPESPPLCVADSEAGQVSLWGWRTRGTELVEIVSLDGSGTDWLWGADHIVMAFDLKELPHRAAVMLSTSLGRGDTPEVIRMEVNARLLTDAYEPITSTNLRQLPVSRLVAEWLPVFAMRADGAALGGDEQSAVRSVVQGRTGRLPRSTEEQLELLETVANAYRAAIRAADRAPNVTLQRSLGYSRSHIARLVGQARSAGLLKPARPGQAGEEKL